MVIFKFNWLIKMFIETLKNSLPGEGKILVDTVVNSGKNVRKENEEFIIKSKKHLTSLIEKLNQFIEQESDKLLKEATNLRENINLNSEKETILSFIEKMKEYKKDLLFKKSEVEKFSENPPGKENLNELISIFNKNLETLQEYGKKVNVSIPWQLAYIAMADTQQSNSIVDFEGGRITDAKGRNIWGAQCSTCDLEIQDGAKGQGSKRIHCLDCEKSDQCMNCFKIIEAIRVYIKEKGLDEDILLEIDPHLNHLKIEENDINVFLKFPVKSQKNLASALYISLKNFSPRPCYYQNKKWHSYEDILNMSLNLGTFLNSVLKENSFIGICSENRKEWLISDMACTFNRFTSIGLHSWPIQDIEYIIKETEMSCIICSKQYLDKFIKMKEKYSFINYILIMDDSKIKENDIISFDQIESTKEDINAFKEKILKESDDNDLMFSLIYSSGTTGTPVIFNIFLFRKEL